MGDKQKSANYVPPIVRKIYNSLQCPECGHYLARNVRDAEEKWTAGAYVCDECALDVKQWADSHGYRAPDLLVQWWTGLGKVDQVTPPASPLQPETFRFLPIPKDFDPALEPWARYAPALGVDLGVDPLAVTFDGARHMTYCLEPMAPATRCILEARYKKVDALAPGPRREQAEREIDLIEWNYCAPVVADLCDRAAHGAATIIIEGQDPLAWAKGDRLARRIAARTMRALYQAAKASGALYWELSTTWPASITCSDCGATHQGLEYQPSWVCVNELCPSKGEPRGWNTNAAENIFRAGLVEAAELTLSHNWERPRSRRFYFDS